MAKILILEDDIVLGNEFSTAFNVRGHETRLACTASEAFAYFEMSPCDVAVVDIFVRQHSDYIPDGGLSFISRIRTLRSTRARREIPIIAISGGALVDSQQDPLLSAISIGATTTLKKPINAVDLITVTEKLLASGGR